MDSILTPIIAVSGIYLLAITILKLKDRFFRKQGFNQTETVRLGIIWFISPIMLLLISLAGIFLWQVNIQENLQTPYFIGLVIGFSLGLVLLYKLLSNKHVHKKQASVNYKSITVLGFLGFLIFKIGGGQTLVDTYLNTHPSLTQTLFGIILSFLLCVFLGNWLSAIFKKPSPW